MCLKGRLASKLEFGTPMSCWMVFSLKLQLLQLSQLISQLISLSHEPASPELHRLFSANAAFSEKHINIKNSIFFISCLYSGENSFQ
ncbi:MAG TPA: hypothetical protein DIV86_02290 [Alphaproteobacteria bacterium]|nr:hypothetical protein [Alphaproteobacteria bacterium]